jgi:integrase
VNGKRRRESTHTTDYKAAQQLLRQRLAAIDRGEAVLVNRRVLVSELYESLEREYRRQGRRTLKALRLRWSHLKPFFGDILATNVTKEMIERYVDFRIGENAARASINREMACLKTAFRLAAERLPRLPVFPAQLAENNVRQGFVEDKEFALLAANAPTLWLRTFLEIGYSLGWRRSEILGLRVRQVDFQQRIIRLEVGSTKNGEGREASITTRMYELLKACAEGKAPDDYLLSRSDGRPISDFRVAWASLCAKSCVPGLLVHDLRRSAARNLRRAGVAESVIMAIGGWRTASMFRRYAITSNTDKTIAMEKLEQHRVENKQKLEREAENSHKSSHNFSSGGQNESDAQTQWTQ